MDSAKQSIYGNFAVLDPQGNIMFRCGAKKFRWYLERNLAEKVDDRTIRLRFEPNGPGHYGNIFYVQERDNCCVVCGSKDKLTRHHVVPHCYRKHLPEEAKTNNYHDILPVCSCCHQSYETSHGLNMRRLLAKKYNAPFHGTTTESQSRLWGVKAARCLVRHWQKIPAHKRTELINRVEDHLGREPTADDIKAVAKEKPHAGDSFTEHAEIVMQQISDFQSFAEDWRRDFVEKMSPRFMPPGWSITQSIVVDREATRARLEKLRKRESASDCSNSPT